MEKKLPYVSAFCAGLVVCLMTVATAAAADVVDVFFRMDGKLRVVQRTVQTGYTPVQAAVGALIAGPTTEEEAEGVYSAIPQGVRLNSLVVSSESVTIDFSDDLLSAEVTEVFLEAVYVQASWTLRQFDVDQNVKLTVDGLPLSSYLPPVIKPAPARVTPQGQYGLMGSLDGHSITLSPGHGYVWNGSGWHTQRPVYCSPLNEEDLHNLEMCQYLETYLTADGMTVRMVRCTDKNYGNHSTGHPWWQMAAYAWLQNIGYPCSVYANDTGDCTLGSGSSESSDDIRSRPLASDYDSSDIYVSVHTNGYLGDCTGSCPTGTETYYDASTEHAPWGAVSQTLGNNVNSAIMSAITANVDSSWTCHGTCVKNSNGNYGEIRIPDRAAILTELGFHDTCDRDADGSHLGENFFRSAAMWGIYKGICDYFGTTPTWAFYSDEYVSDTIPATMEQGRTYDVSVTFRNRGVLWTTTRAFRLGAVDDSDPFTAFNRVDISGEVAPGATYTFSFQMLAPAPGDYVTDWRMVRDGVTWFGATASKSVHVDSSSDPEPPTIPTDLTATATSPVQVQLSWTASTDNVGVVGYDIRRDGVIIGSSPTNSYTDNTASPSTPYTYEVRAKDGIPNYSDWSAPAYVTTPADTTPPTVPTNLAATPTAPTSVRLTWTASTDDVAVAGYDVRRDSVIIGSSATNSYTDSTVSASSSYIYEVRARDAVPNYSGWTSPVVANTPAPLTVVFTDGFDGNMNNWTQGATAFAYDGTVNHGSLSGAGSAKCPVGSSSQMYHLFSRPFASGRAVGWYRDPKGGKNGATCSYTGARQALSLREPAGSASFILDNGLSQNGGSSYTWRLVGVGGGATHTAYATRNPAASCSPTWIYYETVVNANAPGASPAATFTVTVNDSGAGMPVSTTQNIPGQTFYTNTNTGIGRVTLGLGVSTTGADVYWDDIQFEAAPPNPPTTSTPLVLSTSEIRWNFAGFDYNLYGFDVADGSDTIVSPQYPNSGWLNRNSTSWTQSGLTANTQYTRKVRAWNGTLNSAYMPMTAWTLSTAPTAGSVTPDVASACAGEQITWTAAGGFGSGTVQYYRYAWDQNPTYTWTDSEPQWSSGTISTTPTAGGTWYLHVKGFNGADIGNGAYDYAVIANAPVSVDYDTDCDVDQDDYDLFSACSSGPGVLYGPGCDTKDLDVDGDVDQADFSVFQRCYSGQDVLPNPNCAN